jgi:hypothetical protein
MAPTTRQTNGKLPAKVVAPPTPPPRRSPKRSKARPRTAKDRAEHAFLISLYSEIAAAADDESLVFDNAALQIIRRARLGHFLRNLRVPQVSRIVAALGTVIPRPGGGATYTSLNADLTNLQSFDFLRLRTFYQVVGKVILPACACSPTFRAHLLRPDPNTQDQLNWTEVVTLITNRLHSLELFTRTRSLAWEQLLHHSDAYYSRLLNPRQSLLLSFLDGMQPVNITPRNLGIHTAQHLHALADPLHPHEWRLADVPGRARRTRLTYTATNDLVKFRPKPANAVVGTQYSTFHENINEAILLTEYPWTHRHDWPRGNDDPRYAGAPNLDCEVCGESQEWCKRSTANNPQSVVRTCSHQFLELNPCSPLIELVTTPLGTGVRSLQNISDRTYLGVYLGELYPQSKATAPDLHPFRYGGEAGRAYLYPNPLNIRHRGKRHPKKIPGEDDHRYDPGKLFPNEFVSFMIDPAVYGNWTRYINHSCDANTMFTTINVGQRMLTVVQAQREITFEEPITIYYSDDYFDNKPYRCLCGESACLLWQPGVTGPGQLSLGAARTANNPAVPGRLRIPPVP